MQITAVTAHAIKAGQRYQPSGRTSDSPRLPNSDYLRHLPMPQLYSECAEAVVIKVDTDTGLVGWGESQAPVGPEVVLTIIKTILGPAVLGRDPLEVSVRWHEMLGTMQVRGQASGYHVDAMAGLDLAFWDLRGKAWGASLADLLGGRQRKHLPAYVTGLRGTTVDERIAEAQHWTSQGFGIKPCIGLDVAADVEELRRLRTAIGPDASLMADALWGYDRAQALRVGRVLDDLGAAFFEAPLAPDDLDGHAQLAVALDLPVAGGEALRTCADFHPWLRAGALEVCQPDLMRNGVTETVRIATLAQVNHCGITLHTGCSTAIGMAASWQTAATFSHGWMQEFQPVMFDLFTPWLVAPLRHQNGQLVVPDGPGLGVEIDQERMAADISSTVRVCLAD